MPEPRYRVLVLASHAVQYTSPLFRRMAQHPQLDLCVAYCSLRGAEAFLDPEFGTTVQWDVPLLEGYNWIEVANRGSGAETFLGLRNPDLWRVISKGNYDVVYSMLSYTRASYWIAYFAALASGCAFIAGCDQNSLEPRDGRRWKRWFKRGFWPILFRIPDQAVASSSGARALLLSLGIPEQRITLTPLVIDNDWWIFRSRALDREAVRGVWGADERNAVILFCAKLQPWKRPLDLLRAFAKADLPDAILVFAGEGPQRQELEKQATELGVAQRVRFLGFQNQSQLPAVYTAADVMVLPSEYEPFAVVVNEASCCGCPVVASDRVGAARDLIVPVDPGLVFPSGDVSALTSLLSRLCGDRARLRELGAAARERMETWGPQQTIAGMIEAMAAAVRHRHG